MKILSPHHSFAIVSVVALIWASAAWADDDRASNPNREAIKFFETSIRPLLAKHCYQCHGVDEQEGGLRLDHISFLRSGGDNGPAITSHDPNASLLIEAVRYESELEMPPDEPLPENQVKLLERWVAMGSPWPEETVAKGSRDAHGFSQEDRDWWAIQPLTDPPIPNVGKSQARNPIDSFIAAKQHQHQLTPAPEADRMELVRRAYFDLHGLPPTPEQVQEFVNDDSPDAWSRLIDRLLESPRYGERWAQHWLDVVRYAESDGYRQDAYRPDASVYRDYVIDSFNNDKPYDRLVREHLAGDELYPDDSSAYIGTAFLRHGIYEYNQRNAKMHWELIVNELTNVTGEAFLGISIGCAQCHDHKFDPILQKDYFALQAFLASVCWPTDMPLADAQTRKQYDAQYATWQQATAEVRAEIDEMLAATRRSKEQSAVKQFPEDIQKMFAKSRDQRTTYEQQMVMLVERQIDYASVAATAKKSFAKKPELLKRYEELERRLAEFDHLKPAPLPTGFVATDVCCEATPVTLKSRSGEQTIEPGFLTLLDHDPPEIQPTKHTTGRRTALANWIASPDNPLSTRVIVNRLWQHHFCQGIVCTPNDFGTLGESPSHPELLDWLVNRFIAGGWRFKPMHRLIMNSATYRQTARREPTAEIMVADGENRFLWRFPPRRLDAEQRRDAMLAVSGELKTPTRNDSASGTVPVRSVFVKKIRNSPDRQLGMMDAPMGFESTPTRPPTTTPIQTLSMVNGDWTIGRASAMAARLISETNTSHGQTTIDAALIERAYWLAYSRKPSEAELQMAMEFAGDLMHQAPPKPKHNYPNETGVRDASKVFAAIEGRWLNAGALWLQPGSRFERLQIDELSLENSFTIEAIATLDRVYPDATVNTLISRWNNQQTSPGWALGVTSEKSRYKPRNIIVQLIGKDAAGKVKYEVIASDLRFPLNKPAFVAATVHVPSPAASTAKSTGTAKSKSDQTQGTVTFYFRDLSDPKSQLQTVVRSHSIVGPVQNPKTRALVGGRDSGSHLWDGQVARLAIAQGHLNDNQLLINQVAQGGPVERLLDFDFALTGNENSAKPEVDPTQIAAPAVGTHWLASGNATPSKSQSQLHGALTDFCHVLLTSNEFLYLH